jgi:hypothetical protein
MAYSLLKMVQLILSAMDSDEVTAITDTVESQQVVDIIETTYNDICSTIGFPEQWDLFSLVDPANPTTVPTLKLLPDTVMEFKWLQYDFSDDTTRKMTMLSPLVRHEFLSRMNSLDSTDTNVYSYNYTARDATTYNIRGKKNAQPTYYTVLADKTVIFDNYDASVDTNGIDVTKTLGDGKKSTAFSRTDSWFAPFDEQNWSVFFNEAKAQCFVDLKQIPNLKAEQRARQAKVASQTDKDRSPKVPALYTVPNYGRNSGKIRIN